MNKPLTMKLFFNIFAFFIFSFNIFSQEVTLEINSTSKIESDLSITTITATRSGTSSFNTSVVLRFTGLAVFSTDYSTNGNAILIPPGQTTGTLSIENINDNETEGDENIIVRINSVSNGSHDGMQEVTFTIIDDESTLSLEEETYQSKKNIHLYPNPTKGKVSLGSNINKIKIYTVNGKKVKETHGSELDMKELPIGTYLIHLFDYQGLTIKRIVRE